MRGSRWAFTFNAANFTYCDNLHTCIPLNRIETNRPTISITTPLNRNALGKTCYDRQLKIFFVSEVQQVAVRCRPFHAGRVLSLAEKSGPLDMGLGEHLK